jgi:hypothetical protein
MVTGGFRPALARRAAQFNPASRRKWFLADTDEPVDMDGDAAELRRLFEQDRLQAKFVGS